MVDPTDKRQLIEELSASHSAWEALLGQVGEDRLELPGVVGEWSVKDLVAHITAWEQRILAWLEAIHNGTWPQPPEWPVNLNEDGINAWIFAANRHRRLNDVLAESQLVFDQLRQGLDQLTEQDLTETGRFEWLGKNSLAASIGGNSFEHVQEHGRQIRDWLTKRETAA